jgi:hypothetical protein
VKLEHMLDKALRMLPRDLCYAIKDEYNWYFRVIRRNPHYLKQYLKRVNVLSILLLIPKKEIKNYLNNEAREITRKSYIILREVPYQGWMDKRKNELLYVIIRTVKPTVVIETEVAAGVSSTYILYALEHNHDGTLYSIDIRARSFDGINILGEVGWFIPKSLRYRWKLLIGSSKKVLPTF